MGVESLLEWGLPWVIYVGPAFAGLWDLILLRGISAQEMANVEAN